RNAETAKALTVAAAVALEENRIAEAVAGARRAAETVEEALGPESSELIPKLVVLAQSELAAGRLPDAEVAATRAVAIARKGDDPNLAEALAVEADILTRGGRYAEAVAGYERALELAGRAQVVELRRLAVEALLATGQRARALAFAEQAHAAAPA